jgi:hypothetical protein
MNGSEQIEKGDGMEIAPEPEKLRVIQGENLRFIQSEPKRNRKRHHTAGVGQVKGGTTK